MTDAIANWNRRVLLIDDTPGIHDDIRKILAADSSSAGGNFTKI